MRIFLILLFFIVLTPFTFTQQWVKIDSVFSPFGVTSQNFSDPEYCDLDGDGDLDLIVGSTSANRIEYFLNKGTKTAPVFRRDTTMFSSIYANGYQYTNSAYAATVDIDSDGDFDLITGGYIGMILYWNGGDSSEAVWFRDTVTFAAVNALIGTDAKPSFADLDGDGDPDLVIGIGESLFEGPTPGILMGFRNNGTLDMPSYAADNSLVAGIPDVGLNAYPAFSDLDADGDFDMMLGRDLQTMLYYKNTGTKSAPVWTQTSSVVSPLETTTYWKIPAFGDLDGDGDLDLTYGTSDGTISYYRNIGTAVAPQFQVYTSYFQMIRTNGNAASVSLGDIDKDGDLDFLSGDWLGGVQYFRNDGNAIQPSFTKSTSSFTSLDAGSYSTPKFIDIDKDGDLDIVSGELLGKLLLWVNTNGTFSANTTMFAGIDVGYRSAPAFTDIDNDGDTDMLLGSEDEDSVRFYVNNGSNIFTVNNSFISGIIFDYVTHPVFTDLDNDGDMDLVFGSGFGDLYYYQNTGTKNMPVWKTNDALLSSVYIKQGAAPAFADFDGDGKQDMIVAEYSGNFSFFKNNIPTTVQSVDPLSPKEFVLNQNYPNPFNPATTITFSIADEGTTSHSTRHANTTIIIFDMLGREITTLVNEQFSPGTYTVTWNAGAIPSGVYFCRLQSGDFSATKRMMLLK
jgi:hypothetical protein